MRSFDSIAKLIKSKRLSHPKSYSQSELSALLGYKNGQFISNVERALCNIPLKMLLRVTEVLDINKDELKQAILEDHARTIDGHLNLNNSSESIQNNSNSSKEHGHNSDEIYENSKGFESTGSNVRYGS